MNPNPALQNYYSILSGDKKSKHTIARKKGFFDEEVLPTYGILDSCELCEHKCKVNRRRGQEGLCKLNSLRISSAFVHLGEEHFLVPSFTIFFSTCNFSCVFCQNWDISYMRNGRDVTVMELTRTIDAADMRNCKNINLVGGEPTPFLPWIMHALSNSHTKLPIIWNSNFYMSQKSMGILSNFIDLYLSDWKYGNSECAQRLSGIRNYFGIAERNHKLAFEDKDADLVIRHLVLPNHFDCCTKPILERIAFLFGDKVVLNLMDQYRPQFRAKQYADINRELTASEFQRAASLAQELGLNFIT